MSLFSLLLPLGVSFFAALVSTPIGISLARRYGFIDRPRADRWSQREVAKLGGPAIFLACVFSLAWFLPWEAKTLGLWVGSFCICALGLYDDIRPLRPIHKLLCQIMIACIAVSLGVRASFGNELALYSSILPFVSIPISIFWIVGITNAFNLLDNMDGLSAGVAAIASGFLAALGALQGDATLAILGLALCGACLGFLCFNFNPARVFMGDAGSLFLGFYLSSATLLGSWRDASSLSLVLIIPLLLLGVPIFDTTLVTVLRKLHGRPASQGGRDHSSHRLVALGLSERNAVLVLYGICVLLGSTALAGVVFNSIINGLIVAVLAVFLLLFGIFLADVRVYREIPIGPGDGKERLAILNTLLLHKRRIVEVFCDVILAIISYIVAYLLRFEGQISTDNAALIEESLPLVVLAKMLAFATTGVYAGAWKYAGLDDALRMIRAGILGTLAAVLLLVGLTRFEGYSRALFVMDGLLFLSLVLLLRFLWRVGREHVFPFPTHGRRVAIVGSAGASAAVIDWLRRDRSLAMKPVLVIDDEPQLQGRKLHGVKVLMPDAHETRALLQQQKVEEILLLPNSSHAVESAKLLAQQLTVPIRLVPSLHDTLRVISVEQLQHLEQALQEESLDLVKARTVIREIREGATEKVAERDGVGYGNQT